MCLPLRTLAILVGLLPLASGCGRPETPAGSVVAEQSAAATAKTTASDKTRAPDHDPKKEIKPPPAPALTAVPREKLAPDTAILEVELPPGAQATLDGKDLGKQRRFVFEKLTPKQLDQHELSVRFADGKQEQRTLLLKGGWHVRLPLPAADLLRPELVLQTGHTDRVTSVAFSSDGRRVLTGSGWGDNRAILWDAASGQKLRAIEGHFDAVYSVAFSPDGRHVLTGGGDKTAFLWDATSGQKVRAFQGHTGEVRAVAFSPDGRHVLTGSADNRAILWDSATGQKVRAFWGHHNLVHSAAFSPDGRHMVVGSDDKTAILWDAVSGQKLWNLRGHTNAVRTVAFSPNGRQALTGSEDKTAILWDVSSGQKLRAFQGHTDGVLSMAFSADGHQLLTGSKDLTAILWEAASGRKLRAFEGNKNYISSVAFSPDDCQVLTASLDVTLWDAATGKKVRAVHPEASWVNCMTFSPDRRQLLAGLGHRTAILWDAASGQELRLFQGHAQGISSVAFSPDGRQLLTGSWDNTAILWDTASGQKLREFQGHTEGINSLAFSPDGRQALTGSRDGTSRLWDIASGNELARLIHFDGGQDWAVVTPAGLFDGSKGGREKVAFRIGKGLDVVPLDRFFQDFYYPGLLAEIWRGERPMPGKSLTVNPAPSLKMLVHQEAGGQKGQTLIDVAVTDQGGGLKGPWLQHNGATLHTGSKLRQEGKTVHYRFAVTLVPGDNRIAVRAATADGGRESDPASLILPFDGQVPEPHLYVVAIGINRFAKDSGVSHLDCCVPDAKAVADLFRQRTGKLFQEVHVTPLFDEQATKDGIVQAVHAIAQKVRTQDTLVLYVASHGIAVGQRFYLIPHDFKLAKGEPAPQQPKEEITTVALRGYRSLSDERETAVRAHGLAIDELGEALAAVPALKRVLIFDTCHSGSAIAMAGRQRNPFAFRGAMERFSRAQGVYCLSATAADELAAENKELGHSILTYALLAGLQAVERGPLKGQSLQGNADGAVDVLQWFRYARERVPGLYQQYVGRPQQVELSGEDQPSFPLLRLQAK